MLISCFFLWPLNHSEHSVGSSTHLHRPNMHKISVRERNNKTDALALILFPRHDPLYAAFLLVGILGTFKAYPTLADTGLFLSMIVLFPEVYPCQCRFLTVFRASFSLNDVCCTRLQTSDRDHASSPSFLSASPIISSSMAHAGHGEC
jgi:hypothetical protein